MYGAAEVNAQYNRTPTSGAEANRKANEAADEASDKLQGYADDIQVRFWSESLRHVACILMPLCMMPRDAAN
jgi:hypothetical protein